MVVLRAFSYVFMRLSGVNDRAATGPEKKSLGSLLQMKK